jgi:hypothetical protein
MRTLKVLLAVASMFAAVPAFAQGAPGAPPAAKPPAAKPPEPPKMEAPKPSKEIEDLAKGMKGTWKCEGKIGEEGKQVPAKLSVQWGAELDGFWVVGKFTGAKEKGSPMAYKAACYIAYDAAAKQFVRTDFDNSGGWSQMTSKPGDPGKMVWTGEGVMMGSKMAQNENITRKGDKEVEIAGQAGAFKWSFSCKK